MANAKNYTDALARAFQNTKEVMMANILNDVYSTHLVADYNRIEMPRRGRYQVWQGTKIVADRIKHRREALAVMKLLKENKNGTS